MKSRNLNELFPSTFGKRLQETRVNFASLTQEELAKKAGLTAMHISHFECGRRLPSLTNFVALVRALETNPSYMLGLTK